MMTSLDLRNLRISFQVIRDIETGLSRRMGYVSFKEKPAVQAAIDEMHETVSLRCPPACVF